jgi:hypothetical protein
VGIQHVRSHCYVHTPSMSSRKRAYPDWATNCPATVDLPCLQCPTNATFSHGLLLNGPGANSSGGSCASLLECILC